MKITNFLKQYVKVSHKMTKLELNGATNDLSNAKYGCRSRFVQTFVFLWVILYH